MKDNIFKRVALFYYEGFKSMTVGKTLWVIVLIKLFIMFAILRVFFFQPALKGSDEQKADTVRGNLIELSENPATTYSTPEN